MSCYESISIRLLFYKLLKEHVIGAKKVVVHATVAGVSVLVLFMRAANFNIYRVRTVFGRIHL